MSNARWQFIEGFRDYEICTDGRVRSHRVSQTKILSGTVTCHGYVAFMLRDDGGKVCRRLAHRLVGMAFLPDPAEGQTDVCHNDGNPGNNCVGNLRWDTHQGNQMDMRSHGSMQDGEKCITAVLSVTDVLDIRHTIAREGRGAGARLSRKYGVSKGQISRIKTGKRWAALNEVAA